MTLEETREKILTDDAFVLAEVSKIQVLYELKRVIRYNHTRTEVVDTESVAEHVFGAMILAEYFLPLEDVENKWDKNKITQMLLVHDIAEIITGDEIGYLKTDKQRVAEAEAEKKLLAELPETIRENFTNVMNEYEQRLTMEAKFTKAVEKTDPYFHMYSEAGKKIMADEKSTEEQTRGLHEGPTLVFPYINRFYNVIHKAFIQEGFFKD